MGSAIAPSIANLYMTTLEEDSILSPNNPFTGDLLIYKRFIAIFIIFRNSTRLEVFIDWVNKIDNNISFTCQSNESTIPFLDTYVYRTEDN